MSDFTSTFWSVWVAGITLVSIVACGVLLYISGKTTVSETGDNTTGHVWDEDLREMNNPLPRWWVGLFIATLIFALAYLYMYPGLGSFKGSSDWTQESQYRAEVAAGNAEAAPLYARFDAMPVEQVAADPAAKAIGERLFMNNCAQCHGSDARGTKGFPNLTDRDWLHGGTPDDIKKTITDGRTGQMPPLAAAVGSADDVKNLANYVLSLSKSPHDSVRANLGREKYSTCAGCHGSGGVGNPALGAPKLNDDIWLHGYGEAAITAMVTNGKTNQMPAQADKLTPAQIHVLTAYVWGLSNTNGAAR